MNGNFDTCVEMVLQHEGGYVNHPNDPGGETNFGISKRAYPNEDIKNMTKDRAKEIYKADYWDKVKGDDLPVGLDLCVFDLAVNGGIGRASKMLQSSLAVAEDGIIGSGTVSAAKSCNVEQTINKYQDKRAAFYFGLVNRNPKQQVFLAGWMNRCRAVRKAALGMV